MASVCQRGLFVVAFFATLTGVMAETLDSDLIGVVVAAVCVGILSIVIIAFLAYCCFRRMEYNRSSALMRKDSESNSASIAPRWAPGVVPSTMPVYSVPAEPVMYAVPANYYLGHYAPKFLDAEQLNYMRPQAYRQERGEGEMEEEEEEERQRRVREYEERLRMQDEQLRQREEQRNVQQQTDVTTMTPLEPPASQPNGQLVSEFSSSSVNYRVIRKQHKHEKMPEWLRKEYDTSEMSIDVDDASLVSTGSMRRLMAQGTPQQAVRAHVTPKEIDMYSSNNGLHVARDYTIVDYVDPEQPRPSASYLVEDNSQGYRITTATTTTTTTYRAVRANDVSHASESTYVPPASTSTPRAPAVVVTEEEEEHWRMRRPGEGSLSELPAGGQNADVQF